MNQQELSDIQKIQEEEYIFPYHYLDLLPKYEYLYRTMDSYRRLVCELIGPFHGQRLLDAGCGDGRLCYALRDANLRVTGIDYSEAAIRFARAFSPRVVFVVGDLTKYRPEQVFDVIVLMEVLEHSDPELIARVLANLRSCLADDGKLIVTVPSTRTRLIPKHYQHFTVDTLKETLYPHFEMVSMIGHLRTGVRHSLYRMLLKGNYLLGGLRGKVPLVAVYYRLIEWLLASIETCPAAQGGRLITVCRKADDDHARAPRD